MERLAKRKVGTGASCTLVSCHFGGAEAGRLFSSPTRSYGAGRPGPWVLTLLSSLQELCPHFADGETETQRSHVKQPKFVEPVSAEVRFEPGTLWP